MRTFTEFYISAASFVLYKLYTEANLKYPPFHIDLENMNDDEIEKELAHVEALTIELRESAVEKEEAQDDIAELAAETGDDSIQKAYQIAKEQEENKNFFKGNFCHHR